jgi:predicted AAA+ superfamily ATPase
VDHYGAILLTGPRQAGKSTLLRHVAQSIWGTAWTEFSFDTPMDIAAFRSDPDLFFLNHPGPLLLDEVQNVPDIFPWLKKQVDLSPGKTQFLLTGSQHFPLMRGVAESMAGRVLVLDLYPLAQKEIFGLKTLDIAEQFLDPKKFVAQVGQTFPCSDTENVFPAMLQGGYPAQSLQHLGPDWFKSYRATYLQRDILNLGYVENIAAFDRFLVLCAGLSGTIPNKANLADHLGVNAKTVDAWMSLLEKGYQAIQIPAWSQNTTKRVAKRPKFIFGDSGLALHLQAIRDSEALLGAPHFGNLFEAWVITELQRVFSCAALEFDAYHWRTANGQECDLVLRAGNSLIPIEFKHTAKPSASDVKGVIAFRKEYKEATTGLLISMKPTLEWIVPGILNIPLGVLVAK